MHQSSTTTDWHFEDFPSFKWQKIQDFFFIENFHVKQRYFWPAPSSDATLSLRLELLQWLHSKTGYSTLQIYFAVKCVNASLLTGTGQQGHLFTAITYATNFSSFLLYISMLLFSLQLHTMPLITQYVWCTHISFILCYLKMKKRWEDLIWN